MLGTYHERMGDQTDQAMEEFSVPGRVWGRVIAANTHFRQDGDVRPRTDGSINGFQLGVDLLQFGTPDGGYHDYGIYAGHTTGSENVSGFASGLENTAVGGLSPNTTYAGLYWTYTSKYGFYTDMVIQGSWYDGHATAVNGVRAGIDGDGMLASFETGVGIGLSPIWTLEPQAQIIAQSISIDDVTIPNSVVAQRNSGYLTGRAGFRLKGVFEDGKVQPYVRGNLWKGFASTDRTTFITPAAETTIKTSTSSLWGEGGAGVTWTLSPKLAVYGEADYRFTLDNAQGLSGHSTRASIGVKMKF